MASIIPALISAAASIGGGLLSRKKKPKRTGIEKRQKKLVDELLMSLGGEGPYNDLFNADEEAFQKSYVEPALSRFKNQVTPQIQQSYIASGQQRGTGLEDTLTRAGVDMDQMLNEAYYKFQQDALSRKQDAINKILGLGSGSEKGQSTSDALQESTAGYLAGKEDIGNDIYEYFKNFLNKGSGSSQNSTSATGRVGFSA